MNRHGENMSVIKKNEYVLRILAEGDPKTIKYIIREGNIPLGLKEKKRLAKYKEELRALRKKIPLTEKRNRVCKRVDSCLLYWLLF